MCMCAQVFFWDRRTGKLPVSRVAARHASGQLTSLQAVPDGRVIYAGTRAGEVCGVPGTSPHGSCQRKMCVPESHIGPMQEPHCAGSWLKQLPRHRTILRYRRRRQYAAQVN